MRAGSVNPEVEMVDQVVSQSSDTGSASYLLHQPRS
jgi:hypothetical protein